MTMRIHGQKCGLGELVQL